MANELNNFDSEKSPGGSLSSPYMDELFDVAIENEVDTNLESFKSPYLGLLEDPSGDGTTDQELFESSADSQTELEKEYSVFDVEEEFDEDDELHEAELDEDDQLHEAELEENKDEEYLYEEENLDDEGFDEELDEEELSEDDEIAGEIDFEDEIAERKAIQGELKEEETPAYEITDEGEAEESYEFHTKLNEDDEFNEDELEEEEAFDEEITSVDDHLTYDMESDGFQSSHDEEVDLDAEQEFHESLFLEPSEGEGVFDEALDLLSEEVNFMEPYIPASKLRWRGGNREQLQFMRKVYEAHVAKASKRRSFQPSLPKDQRAPIEKKFLQRDAARALKGLLQAARQEIYRLHKDIKIEISSAYRSADRQFELWPQRFRDYYKRTQKHRAKLSGGEHGTKSENYMVGFISARFAAPGYSLHQSGLAVDLQPTENGKTFTNKTTPRHRKNWRETWTWNWLYEDKNAAIYGFYQNKKIDEPWHWEYRSKNGTRPKIPEQSAGTNDVSSWGGIIEKAKDVAVSAKLLYIAMAAISKGERDENKITDAVFNAKHPELDGRKLRSNEKGLQREWVTIRNDFVRPMIARLQQRSSARTKDNQPKKIEIDSTPSESLPEQKNLGTLIYTGKPIKTARGSAKLKPYLFTNLDLIWFARLLEGEAGGGKEEDLLAVAFTTLNKYALMMHHYDQTFHDFIIRYSTTLQPVLKKKAAAARHYKSKDYVQHSPLEYYPILKSPKGKKIPMGQIKRHLDLQKKKFPMFSDRIRRFALGVLSGTIQNPGIGLATEFDSTRIYWKQDYWRRHKGDYKSWQNVSDPTEKQWIEYTKTYAASHKLKWIGKIDGLNQFKNNAFFLDNRTVSIPADSVKVIK